MKRWITGVMAVFMLAGSAWAQEAVVSIDAKPNNSRLPGSGEKIQLLTKPAKTDKATSIPEEEKKASDLSSRQWNKPVIIRSREEAARYFKTDQLKALNKAVDFTKQFVLLFAWAGSGQDELIHEAPESDPKTIVFARTRGATDDLRPHTKVFALRSKMKWRVEDRGHFKKSR